MDRPNRVPSRPMPSGKFRLCCGALPRRRSGRCRRRFKESRPPFLPAAWACSSPALMPPVSPCGRVVDFVRSCSKGFWRFFPNRPDLLTEGFLYYAKHDTPSIQSPHSFGSASWNKDGMVYPVYPTGQLHQAGTSWWDGRAPEPLPPDQQIFSDQAFGEDLTYPQGTPVETRYGFDKRCFLIEAGGVVVDLDPIFLPDIVDCCWQRVLAAMLRALASEDPGAVAQFTLAARLLWGPNAVIDVQPLDTNVNRFALVQLPNFQVLFRVGTQVWQELVQQIWHGFGPPTQFGDLRTERVWSDEATAMASALNALGWNPDLPATFVGHSKGAATLWILARRMTDERPIRRVEILTFGCPKVGDPATARQANIRNSRHVKHSQDPVPLIPANLDVMLILFPLLPLADLIGLAQWTAFPVYQQTGAPGNNVLVNGEDLPWQFYAAQINTLLQGQTPPLIEQHFLTSYVAALASCCSAPIFPFTHPLWTLLFGLPDNGFGGPVVGGRGELAILQGRGGFRINGRGDVFGMPGGLMVDGAGIIVFTPGVVGSGGVQVGGAGYFFLEGVAGLEIGGNGDFAGAVGGAVIFGSGGIQIGGSAELRFVGTGGVELGGAGATAHVGSGGVKSGGSGVGGAVLLGSGGVKIGGTGVLVLPNAFKQSKSAASGTTVSSLALTLNSNVTAGSLLVFALERIVTGTLTVTDNINGTYSLAKTVSQGTTSALELYYFKNSAGGSCTITVTAGVNMILSMALLEYSGPNPTSPLDGNVSASGFSTSAAGGSISPTAGDLVVAVYGSNSSASGHATGLSGAYHLREDRTGASELRLSVADFTSIAGAQNPAFTLSTFSGWYALNQAFKQ